VPGGKLHERLYVAPRQSQIADEKRKGARRLKQATEQRIRVIAGASANISAFNIANALGGLIGGAIVDSSFGASAIPFAAAIVPSIALFFILSQERRSVAPVYLGHC
jgi:MFS family permease